MTCISLQNNGFLRYQYRIKLNENEYAQNNLCRVDIMLNLDRFICISATDFKSPGSFLRNG